MEKTYPISWSGKGIKFKFNNKIKKVCQECNQEIRTKNFYLKRIAKIGITILIIKGVRVFIKDNETSQLFIQEILNIAPAVDIVKILSVYIMKIGFIILGISWLKYRNDFFKKGVSTWSLFFILDGVFAYIFPEIPAAIIEAIYKN